MNNEIKEILDRIETASEIFDCLLKPEECTELLDFITNLKQDNTMYAQLKDEYEEEIKDLQQENERLKHDINIFKNDKVYERLGKLIEENEDYKSRCEKASEYIKENTEEYRHDMDLKDKRLNVNTTEFIDNLLNILQNGSDSL